MSTDKKTPVDPMQIMTEEEKANEERQDKKLIATLKFACPKLYDQLTNAVMDINHSAANLRKIESNLNLMDAIRDVVKGYKAYNTYSKLETIIGLINQDIEPKDLAGVDGNA